MISHSSSRSPLAAILAAGLALSFALGAALVTSVISAAPASAHAILIKITPAAKTKLTAAPTQVVLEFNEAVSTTFITVSVTTDAGVSVARGKPTVLDGKVTQPLGPDLASGDYRVAFRVAGDDGHPIPGESSFTLKLAATTSPTTSAVAPSPSAVASPATSSVPVSSSAPLAEGPKAVQEGWLTRFFFPIAGTVALLLIGGGALLWERQRR